LTPSLFLLYARIKLQLATSGMEAVVTNPLLAVGEFVVNVSSHRPRVGVILIRKI